MRPNTEADRSINGGLQTVMKKKRSNLAKRLKKCVKNNLVNYKFSLQHQTLGILKKVSSTKPKLELGFKEESSEFAIKAEFNNASKNIKQQRMKKRKNLMNGETDSKQEPKEIRILENCKSKRTSSTNIRKDISSQVVENATVCDLIRSSISSQGLEEGGKETTSLKSYKTRKLNKKEKKKSKESSDITLQSIDTSDVDTSNLTYFHKLDESKVLLSMVHPCSLYFCGVLQIEVLSGEIDVLGSVIDNNCSKQTVYSLRGLCNLSLTTKESSAIDIFTMEKLLSLGLDKSTLVNIEKKLGDRLVFIILQRDDSVFSSVVLPELIEKYTGDKFKPIISNNEIEKALDCVFSLYSDSEDTRLYRHIREWDDLVDHIKQGNMKTVLCGGKGVGKSTLLRYLINQTLLTWKEVLVIDVDPGQSEFMVPGCISACLVRTSLLGPNFTHLQDPVRSVFLGDIDVTKNSNRYIRCVQDIIDYCFAQDEFKDIPWFVNTMGFCVGFGIIANSTVIKLVNPSTVVQIKGQNAKSNFPSQLTPKYVMENLHYQLSHKDNELVYDLFTINSAVYKSKNNHNSQQLWGCSAQTLRQIVILSYFGKLLSEENGNIFAIKPYMAEFSKLHLSTIDETTTDMSSLLDVMNGCLVALCQENSEDDFSNCLGFGIVRAIDKDDGKLYLLTPISEEKMQEVTSLVKGSILLPERLYTDPEKSVQGHVPFVSLSCNILSKGIQRKSKFATHALRQ